MKGKLLEYLFWYSIVVWFDFFSNENLTRTKYLVINHLNFLLKSKDTNGIPTLPAQMYILGNMKKDGTIVS